MNDVDARSRSSRQKTALFLLGNFVGSAVMPFLLSALLLKDGEEFTSAQAFGIAALTFIALAMIGVTVRLEAIRREQVPIERFLSFRNALDVEVNAIRATCDIAGSSGSGAILPEYFLGLVRDFRRMLDGSLASCEIPVDETHLFLNDLILDQFGGRKEDIVCVVHMFAENEMIVRAHELEWLRKVDAMNRARRIRCVRRLFVVTPGSSELEDRVSRMLLFAHQHDRSYDYRVMSRVHFDELLHDYQLSREVIDFGIYGNYTVFKSLSYSQGREVGVYSVFPPEIEKFQTAFDACWMSPVATRPEISVRGDEDLPRSMGGFLRTVSAVDVDTPSAGASSIEAPDGAEVSLSVVDDDADAHSDASS